MPRKKSSTNTGKVPHMPYGGIDDSGLEHPWKISRVTPTIRRRWKEIEKKEVKKKAKTK